MLLADLPEAVLPLVLLRGRKAVPVDETTTPRPGDRVVTATLKRDVEGVEPAMASQGWLPVPMNHEAGGGENG
jgi:hypothetical protein